MKKQWGFTLLEVIVVVAIIAASAMMIISWLPEANNSDRQIKQITDLITRASDKAIHENRVVGIRLGQRDASLVVRRGSDEDIAIRSWQQGTQPRSPEKPLLPQEIEMRLNGEALPYSMPRNPQLIFMPDGEMSTFTLSLEDRESGNKSALMSKGYLPLFTKP